MSQPVKAFRKIVYLSFPPDMSGQPVVCNLTRKFDLCFNILKAQITPRQEGFMTLEITGPKENYQQGVDYLKSQGVSITPVAQKIARDEESCMQCGLCTALCTTRSLSIDLATRRVQFDPETCSGCGMCVRICPVHAMDVDLENGTMS
jgi:ferredoxin